MDCPTCRDQKLEPKELEEGLVAAVCDQCHGALLSLMNYRYWVDKGGADKLKQLDDDTVVIEDNDKAQTCPKCARLMTKFRIGVPSSHRLDLCTGCDEAWLDNGEWNLLKQLDVCGKLPKIFTDAWQRNIRIDRQQQRLDDRYESLLGLDDFQKLRDFKQWLDGHDEKTKIKHYLVTNFS